MNDILNKVLTIINQSEPAITGKTIEICLVNSKTIKDLNRRYLGKDAVTDILSFSNEFTESNSLGELIINIDLLPEAKQSDYMNNNLVETTEDRYNLIRLFIHGILHLLGYDHINSNKEKLMKAKEEQLSQDIMSHSNILTHSIKADHVNDNVIGNKKFEVRSYLR